MQDLIASVKSRRYEESIRILNSIGNSVAVPATFRALIKNPSSRLRLTIFAYMQMGETDPNFQSYDDIDAYNATWQIRARTVGTGDFGSPPMHYIISSVYDTPRITNLPNAYELQSYVEQLEVIGSLSDEPEDSGGNNLGTYSWNVKAIWEPVDNISDQHLEALFKRCSISGTPTIS